jgi:hypothetical protein
MTATRIARVATVAVAALAWVFAATLLWRTKAPGDLDLPALDETAIFGARLVERAQDYERFLSVNWLLSTVAGLAALAWTFRSRHAAACSIRSSRGRARD